MGFKLSEMFVEFGAKGADALKKSIDSIGKEFGTLGSLAKDALVVVTGGLSAVVGIGFAGTIQAERFGQSIKRVCEVIASLFMPIMETLTYAFDELAYRLGNSEGAERFQEAISKIADAMLPVIDNLIPIAVFALESFAKVMEDVIVPVMEKVAKAMAWLTDDFIPKLASVVSYVIQLARAVGLVGEGLTTAEQIANGSRSVERGGSIARVSTGRAGTEGIADTYRRIQVAIGNTSGPNYPQRQVQLTEQQLEEQRQLRALIDSRLGAAVQR